MSTLDDAFKRGQEAYQNATRAKAEIQVMFDRLSAVVEAGTGGRVRVQRATLHRVKEGTRTVGLGLIPESEAYEALIAVRIGESLNQQAELCSVKISPHGYPVEFRFPGEFISASDRESLESALASLIGHPNIAGKIERLRQIEVPDNG